MPVSPDKEMMRYLLLVAMMLICFSSLLLGAGEDLFIEVESEGIQKMEIGVIAFQPKQAESGPPLTGAPWTVVATDLRFSGRFNVTEFSVLDTAELHRKNIAVFIDGKWSREGEKVVLDCFVHDAFTLSQITGKQYSVREKDVRRASHLFSDEAVFRLFGEKGIASTRIVCVAQFGKAKEICIMDYDGYNLTRLTSNNQLNLSPCFSPDNKSVVYTSYRQGTPALYKTGIYTGKTVRLTTNNRLNFSPSWSSVDDRIAFASTMNGDCDIYTMDADGGAMKRITMGGAIESSPCYSPNGYEITFTSDRTGNPQVYIMDNEGTHIRRLTFEGKYNDAPTWSPKGDKITYISLEKARFDIYTVDLEGSNVKRLTQENGSNEHPSFSPDGRLLVFSSTRAGGSDLYLMGADGTDQTRIPYTGNLS